jgi:hypothetical protein
VASDLGSFNLNKTPEPSNVGSIDHELTPRPTGRKGED